MFLRAGDTVSGKEGRAVANINGEIRDLFFIKSMEATFQKQKTEVRALGKRSIQHKGVGWSGTGTMTLYYLTTAFRELVLEYAKTGKDTYFSILIMNEDPGSTIGNQMIALYNCNIDSVLLAKLDVDDDTLDEDIEFTFDDFDILNTFNEPITYI